MPLGLFTELVVKPIKCLANGEKYNCDVAAIVNPLRAIRNTAQMIESDSSDKSIGCWIGRRCLGGGNVGLSFSPGVDVYHWAIAIEGYIYEIDVNGKSTWRIKTDSQVYSSYGRSFEWFRITGGARGGGVVRSRGELAARANSLEGTSYGHCLGCNPNKDNCQVFCQRMLAYAVGVSNDQAALLIVGAVGTVLF